MLNMKVIFCAYLNATKSLLLVYGVLQLARELSVMVLSVSCFQPLFRSSVSPFFLLSSSFLPLVPREG